MRRQFHYLPISFVPRHFWMVLTVFLVIWPHKVWADQLIERFQVYAFELKDRLGLEGSGHYHPVMNYIFQDVRHLIDLSIYPIPRAVEQAEPKDRVCLFPTTSEMVDISFPNRGFDTYVDSTTIDLVSGHIYSSAGTPAISDYTDVKGLVGHLTGGAIRNILLAHLGDKKDQVEFVSVNSEANLVQMLQLGRIDYLIGHHPDVPLAIDRLEIPQLAYNKDLPLFTVPVTLTCAPFRQHEDVMVRISERIEEANRSGLLKTLLGTHAQIPELTQGKPPQS